jgi:hypothetical protein
MIKEGSLTMGHVCAKQCRVPHLGGGGRKSSTTTEPYGWGVEPRDGSWSKNVQKYRDAHACRLRCMPSRWQEVWLEAEAKREETEYESRHCGLCPGTCYSYMRAQGPCLLGRPHRAQTGVGAGHVEVPSTLASEHLSQV